MKEKLDALIQQMTLEEECSMLSGESFWYTQSIPRLEIEPMMLTDGSAGLRKQTEKADHLGQNPSVPATCFPSEASMASSWNPDLIREVGRGLGRECRAQDVAAILGPGANIKRSPLCGRNFEYFSEDPFLSSRMAAAFIQGIQSAGVGACIKHFAANNQETHRLTTDVAVDERTLHEIYLESFRYAIVAGKPWMVMCAYNRLNGVFASESKSLLRDVLRRAWGYDGVVVTDWGGVNDRVKSVEAGLDLEMPDSGGVFDRKVQKAVEQGTLEKKYVDESVRRILNLQSQYRQAKTEKPEFRPEQNHRLSVQAGGEGVVLLKNEDRVLPLKRSEKIAVVGEFAVKPRFQGGGSSHTNPTILTNAREELEKQGAEVTYAAGFRIDDRDSDPELADEALRAAQACDKVVVFAGLSEKYETEGIDRKTLDLPRAQNRLIQKLAEQKKNVTVVLSNGAPVLMPWKEQVQGILEGYLLGQASGEILAKILFGEINPSGKLAETFPARLEDTPCYLDFPGHGGQVEYRENLFVGYRYYDTRSIEPLFEFGFGLSYTEFAYTGVSADRDTLTDREEITVRVQVKNVGETAGSEIVQLYVHDRQTAVQRPERELKGFAKIFLQPGEEKTVSTTLDKHAFAYYDVQLSDWLVQSGKFDLLVGRSSRDIQFKKTVEVIATVEPKLSVHRNTSFGEIYQYAPTRDYAKELIAYFERESGIDFHLGDNIDDFALTVISDFPLKALVTFTKGRFSEDDLQKTILKLNSMKPSGGPERRQHV